MDRPCMDNNRLIVVSETIADFRLAMHLAFRQHAEAWSWWLWDGIRPDHDTDRSEDQLGSARGPYLVLSWDGFPQKNFVSSKLDDYKNLFPVGLTHELASDFAWSWLMKQEYRSEPDHDGSNGRGFIMFNDTWGHVGKDRYGIVAIGPAWAMRGK